MLGTLYTTAVDNVYFRRFLWVMSAMIDQILVSISYVLSRFAPNKYQGLYPAAMVALVELQRSLSDDIENTVTIPNHDSMERRT
jgi:hypothetical protein